MSVGKQATEMLKGVLEGIVLALLSRRPAYGYELTAWLREQGFVDIAEGTVYALLVRIEQRKVYSMNPQGEDYLAEFWRTWGFLAERLAHLRDERNT